MLECSYSGDMYTEIFNGCYLFSDDSKLYMYIPSSISKYNERVRWNKYNIENWGNWKNLCEGCIRNFYVGLAKI